MVDQFENRGFIIVRGVMDFLMDLVEVVIFIESSLVIKIPLQ
jgi:hypothetical protein